MIDLNKITITPEPLKSLRVELKGKPGIAALIREPTIIGANIGPWNAHEGQIVIFHESPEGLIYFNKRSLTEFERDYRITERKVRCGFAARVYSDDPLNVMGFIHGAICIPSGPGDSGWRPTEWDSRGVCQDRPHFDGWDLLPQESL